MIGNIILQRSLAAEVVKKVTIVVRKSQGLKHPKLVEVVHHDFLNYDLINQRLQNHDVCFFCIGVYTGKVNRAEFRTITVDYVKAFVNAIKENTSGMRMCFLSGQGADEKEKSKVMFAKDKGVAENILKASGFRNLFIFRPAYIYPVVKRKEPNLMYRAMRRLYPVLHFISPGSVITSDQLAAAMFYKGLYGQGSCVFENSEIRHITLRELHNKILS